MYFYYYYTTCAVSGQGNRNEQMVNKKARTNGAGLKYQNFSGSFSTL